ncbi:MAG: SAM-dependent methyltransferase [Saprospiraceae bacterium]|nr:SAM-dependent methyltransferase [Saprospiraceae bacterium]
MTKRDQFFHEIRKLLDDQVMFKLILSKPRPGVDARSAMVTLIEEDGVRQFKYVEKTATQHFTQVVPYVAFYAYLEEKLTHQFYYCELFSEQGNGALLQNQKGTATFIRKKGTTKVETASHNREKDYFIAEDSPFLELLGISSTNGRVFEHANRKYRQINKFVEIINSLIEGHAQTLTIADMGSGKAYLTFALYHYLTLQKGMKVELTGYEIRQELVDQCNGYAAKLGFENLKFVCANIEAVKIDAVDMVISLHACDIATDMSIFAGLQARATYMVLAPCCHKQIRKQIELRNGILKHGILLERQAEIITDAIRALVLEDHGYKTKVFEFISAEHTSKNTMIIARKHHKNDHAALEIKDIKETYGIRFHYLEKLLEIKY